MATKITTPAGTSGLAVEPWSKGEIYAVAADWAQASCQVYVYGENGWTSDECGRQVADFRHDDRAALEAVIRSAIEMGGDEPDDDEVESILGDAESIGDEELAAMTEMLDGHGSTFAGNCTEDSAQDWIDNGFAADDASEWCDIGCWDASTAAALRDAKLTPSEAEAAADLLRAEEEATWDEIDVIAASDDDDWTPCDRDSKYTDGSPIYSACNHDTSVREIIDAAKKE